MVTFCKLVPLFLFIVVAISTFSIQQFIDNFSSDIILNANGQLTGIGLPFLGVIAIGVSKSSGVYELAKRINQTYAMVFTILLY
ncbi:branched-chain amino acid transport system II carrier protein, partial [Enterococcus faecium]|uniref:branched-chain amino acid transport system II carrier protein n=1 Tax=Enterococcus faecium TaxID=1352 RepID=UPI0029313C45